MVDFQETPNKTDAPDPIVETPPPPANTKSPSPKPFPWPICLSLLTCLYLAGIFSFGWYQQNLAAILRIAWISLCSIVPGLNLLAFIGAMTQFRKRPVLGVLTLILTLSVMAGCYWIIQLIIQNAEAVLP